MEILISLFLLSGLLKSFGSYFGFVFPVDLTLLFAGLMVVALIKDLFQNKITLRSYRVLHLLLLITFFCFAAFSTLYSTSSLFKYQKLLQLSLVVLIACIIGLSSNLNVKRFLISFGFISILLNIIYSIVVFKFGTSTVDLTYKSFIGQYLSLAFNTGITGLIFLFDKSYFNKKTRIYVFSICFLLLLLSGARGPLLILIASIVLFRGFPFISQKISKARNSMFIGVSVLSAIAVAFPFAYAKSELLQKSIWRLSLLVTDITGSSSTSGSVNTRLDSISFAFNTIFSSGRQFLLGNGIGSFGPLYTGADVKEHPHNIFVEIWFDLGFLGLALFIIAVAFPIIAKNKKEMFSAISGVVILYLALNYSKSTSYSEIRIGMAFITLLIITQQKQLKQFVHLPNKEQTNSQK